jgi:hypothetical protein
MEVDAAKSQVEKIGLERGDILKPPFTTCMVEAMAEKRNQDKEKFQHIVEMYEALAQEVKYVGVYK